MTNSRTSCIRPVILLLSILVVCMCTYIMIINIPNLDGEVIDAAAQACERIPVPEAAHYTSGPGNHPFVVITESGRSVNSHYYPENWLPNSVSELQIVACVGEEKWQLVQTCKYINGPSILRYQSNANVVIVEARTGNTVDQFILEGDLPRQCRDAEAQGITELRGYSVRPETAVRKVIRLLNP
jgi:hypothetical protein